MRPPRSGAGRGARHWGLGSLDAVWLAIAAAYPFVVLNFANLPPDDGDFWWTMVLGRATWTGGGLPAVDPLPYTPTPSPYVQAQWLAGVIFYGTYLLGGFEGLLVLRAAIVGAVFGLLYVGCRRAGAMTALAGLCTLLALPLVNVGLSMRPQILALVPFMLYLEGTRHPLRFGRALYALPLVMALWANVHGSFLFGLALVGLALAGRLLDLVRGQERGTPGGPGAIASDREARALAVLLVLSALAVLVNPHGLGFIGYLRDYLAVNPGHTELGGLATEWLPTSLGTPGGPSYFGWVAAIGAALYVAARRAASKPGSGPLLSAAEGLRLAAFAWVGLRWIRGIAWWGLVAPAPLAAAVQQALVGTPAGPAPRGRPAANGLVIGLIALIAVGSLPWWRAALPLFVPETRAMVQLSPLTDAAGVLARDPGPGQLFHYIAWGPYLAWRLGPGQRIFVDGRFEAYAPQVFEDYARISHGAPDWEGRLAQYGVGRLVLSRDGQAGLVQAATASPNWRLVFADGDVVVLQRRS